MPGAGSSSSHRTSFPQRPPVVPAHGSTPVAARQLPSSTAAASSTAGASSTLAGSDTPVLSSCVRQRLGATCERGATAPGTGGYVGWCSSLIVHVEGGIVFGVVEIIGLALVWADMCWEVDTSRCLLAAVVLHVSLTYFHLCRARLLMRTQTCMFSPGWMCASGSKWTAGGVQGSRLSGPATPCPLVFGDDCEEGQEGRPSARRAPPPSPASPPPGARTRAGLFSPVVEDGALHGTRVPPPPPHMLLFHGLGYPFIRGLSVYSLQQESRGD